MTQEQNPYGQAQPQVAPQQQFGAPLQQGIQPPQQMGGQQSAAQQATYQQQSAYQQRNEQQQQPMAQQQAAYQQSNAYQQQQQAAYQQQPAVAELGVAGMTKDEFAKLPQMAKAVKNIKTSAIICYICAGITALLAIAMSPYMIIDAVILGGLGVAVQLRNSFPAAIVLTAYSAVNMIYTIVEMGQAGGWLILVAGVSAVVATNKLRKAWNEYQKTGVLPTNSV